LKGERPLNKVSFACLEVSYAEWLSAQVILEDFDRRIAASLRDLCRASANMDPSPEANAAYEAKDWGKAVKLTPYSSTNIPKYRGCGFGSPIPSCSWAIWTKRLRPCKVG
jgi:hypothetical protein